jgi:class 3 adenylate cyclase
MEPENLRELFSAYQKCVSEIEQASAGFVAKYMGGKMLIYFGYPRLTRMTRSEACAQGWNWSRP